jgi:hypothetical protein
VEVPNDFAREQARAEVDVDGESIFVEIVKKLFAAQFSMLNVQCEQTADRSSPPWRGSEVQSTLGLRKGASKNSSIELRLK